MILVLKKIQYVAGIQLEGGEGMESRAKDVLISSKSISILVLVYVALRQGLTIRTDYLSYVDPKQTYT